MADDIISQSCSWFHREQNYAKALAMEAFTGIGINRLGQYQQCISDADSRYFLMQYNFSDTNTTFYTGICYSSNCTSNDLIYITKSLNQYFPLPFQHVKIYQPQKQAEAINPYTIACISTISVIIFIGILASILQKWCNAKPTKDQNSPKSSGFPQKLLSLLSISSSISFLLHKSSNNERIKVIAGLRAFAFLGMTLHCMLYILLKGPTLPKPSRYQRHLVNLFYFYDLWLMISGFYYAFQLAKNWMKDERVKNVMFGFGRKFCKIGIVSAIGVLITYGIFYASNQGPQWSINAKNFIQKCHIFNIFSQCNYWLWIWQIQIQMCLITSILFIIAYSKFKISKIIYIIFNVLFFIASFLMAFFYGKSRQDLFSYQGSIIRCPIVSGMSFLVGFNLGLSYFYFRSYRNKSKLLIIRIFSHKLIRVLTSVLSLALIILLFTFILYFQQTASASISQLVTHITRLFSPMLFTALILPQLLGYQNLWGAMLKDRFMNLASKLSFSTFTLYYGVCLVVVSTLSQDMYVNFGKIVGLWLASLLPGIAIGGLLCGFVEVPVYRALAVIFGRNCPRGFIQFY